MKGRVSVDCPDLKRAIEEGLVVLDDRKYVKWADDLGDVSMFPSMKDNVEARRIKTSKGMEPVRSQSIKITFEGDMTTTPIRVATTKSARGSTSKKTDMDYVMTEKDGQRVDGEEVILSPRKRGVKKFLMKSSLDEIDTVEPLRRALRQPMQCSILEYLAASKPTRDELQMITKKTSIPLSGEGHAPKAEASTVTVTGVTARADRMATDLLDGMEGVPPDKFYILGSGAVETIINEDAVLDAVIDNGSEAVIIDENLAVQVGLGLDRSYLFEIETADGRKQQITRTIVAELNDGVVGGHRGVKGTYEKIRRLYWWEGQYKDVERYSMTCEECQKRALVKYKEPIHPSYPTRPGEKIHIDLVKMPRGVSNMNYVVNIRDDFTGFVDGRPIRSKAAKEVKNFVLEYLSRYGCVSKIVMDRGAEFLADEVESVFRRTSARVSIATAYHPQSNSPVERGHQTLIASLSKWCKGKDNDWPRYFRYAIWADNVTVRASTGYPPYTLWFGRHCPLPIEFHVDSWTTVDWAEEMSREELIAARTRQIAYGLEENLMTAADRLAVERDKGKERWDKNVRIKKERVSVGDMVLLYDAALERTWTGKLANKWMGPYRVVEALDWGAYMIAELDGSKWKDPVAGARLKLFRIRPAPALSLTSPKGKGKAMMEDGAPLSQFEVGESSKKRKRIEKRKVKGLA
ncbi:hypothetical protein CBR_g29994 [Chara braunii]|uniref:Integrase catalytic domain-containing protein n=1 Tax=Chara braunii TaxID=69332 RepID=A0A388LBN4_CHABU|nr:hypothetical protein CBR_g29994 [Chara braunii]|eukprot:GBG79730.1 hypothetical protein CBR_g29994 [Chara braunii]